MDKPKQPPEGLLIKQAIDRDPDLSIREVARRAELSEGRVRQIINGYLSAGAGQYVKVTAPAETLARIAWEVGLGSVDLRDAGRADAAVAQEQYWQAHPEEHSDSIDWNQVQKWAAAPHRSKAPPELLEVFDDEDIAMELRNRLSMYRYLVNEYKEAISSDTAQRAEDQATRQNDAALDELFGTSPAPADEPPEQGPPRSEAG